MLYFPGREIAMELQIVSSSNSSSSSHSCCRRRLGSKRRAGSKSTLILLLATTTSLWAIAGPGPAVLAFTASKTIPFYRQRHYTGGSPYHDGQYLTVAWSLTTTLSTTSLYASTTIERSNGTSTLPAHGTSTISRGDSKSAPAYDSVTDNGSSSNNNNNGNGPTRARMVSHARRGEVAELEALIEEFLTVKDHHPLSNNNPYKDEDGDTISDADDRPLSYYMCYSYLLDALAAAVPSRASSSSGDSDVNASGERAEQVLQLLEQRYGADWRLGPVVYNKVLKVWKNSSAGSKRLTTLAIGRAEAILKHMVDLNLADIISYTTYMAMLAAHGTPESAQRAQDIVETMLSNHLQHVERMRAMVTESSSSSMTTTMAVPVKPECQTWNTVLHAWVRCGEPARAEEGLCRMEGLADPDMAPNVVSYCTVMDGWSKLVSPATQTRNGRVVAAANIGADPLERMERLFETMKTASDTSSTKAPGIRPNLWTHATLLYAYAKQHREKASQKAEDLIFEMYRQYKEHGRDDLKPNTQLVSAVIEAWQKSSFMGGSSSSSSTAGALRAEALLNWMIDANDRDLAPNQYSFCSVIAAWARCRSIGKAAQARRVLDRMIELHESGRLESAPNAFCYSAVINSCAYSEKDEAEKSAALRIAIGTFKELEHNNYCQPTHVTYSSMLTALRNLLPDSPKRSAAVQAIFQKAVQSGLVDEVVAHRVQATLTPNELRELCVRIHGQDVDFERLPHEWVRNVPVHERVRRSPRP